MSDTDVIDATVVEPESVDLSVAACVTRGMDILDADRPNWWHPGVDAVNLSTLRMHDPTLCIYGQVYRGAYDDNYWRRMRRYTEEIRAAGGPLAEAMAALALTEVQSMGGTVASESEYSRAVGNLYGFDVLEGSGGSFEALAYEWRRVIIERREAAIA